MPIMSTVEARSIRGRLRYTAITLLLSLGAITILYPFLVMVSGSFRSEIDQADLDLVPAYWTESTALYQKFLETKYNQDVDALNRAHGSVHYSFRDARAPDAHPAPSAASAAEFRRFLDQARFPRHWRVLGGAYGVRTVPEQLRQLRQRLRDQFDGDLAALGRAVGTPPASWNSIIVATPDWTTRRYDYPADVVHQVYFELLEEADPAQIQYVSLTGRFLASMIHPVYGRTDTRAYNAAHKSPLSSWDQFQLPQTLPPEDHPQLRKEWIEFVREELNPSFITFTGPPDRFAQFVRQAYRDDLAELNRAWQVSLGSFDQVAPPDGQWLSGQRRQDYQQFLAEQPLEQLTLVGPEYAWRNWQNAQGQTPAPMPIAALELDYVQSSAAALRWTYAARNYINVFDELIFEGRALANTLVFCLLAIAAALLVNPLAAYAMSRYRLPGTYKLLLVLMATMAFPPMVTLIPQFILLREAGLLNTFAALVLPLAANGYLIFLLKGFFDSLPAELYEAAMLDGAGEIRMFFQITMALSKPILAVIALMTFNGAYTAFLYPLLVAPDQDMWLISVWLYQYQMKSSSGGVFASVVITSLPTLGIFLLTQRTIMRGIVVPTEK